jgi:lysophospholipase L1-like esterase
MEGVNDLNAKVNNPDDPNDLQTAGDALTSMVRRAKNESGTVAIATLPPQRSGWRLLTGRPARSPELIDALNERIRQLASTEGAVLVDIAAAFNGDLSLISADGLHPTQAGYDRIADTFFAVLRPIVAGL